VKSATFVKVLLFLPDLHITMKDNLCHDVCYC